MSIGYMAQESDWSKGLSEADDLLALESFVESWQPFVNDAMQVVREMDPEAFEAWRIGLAKERSGKFAGEEHATRFGALLLPVNLLHGSAMAAHFQAPLGAALIRMRELGKLRV